MSGNPALLLREKVPIVDKLNELLKAGPSRRRFLAGVGAAGAAAAVVGCGGSSTPAPTPTPTPTPTASATDLAVLNFALNLEYLEAEFYLRAATGSGIPSANIGSNPGTVTGGTQVPFAGQTALQEYANEIAQDELNHVIYLRSAITSFGGTPVDRPAIDFTDAFNAAASAAGIGSTFNPFADPMSFLVGAFVFEDVGVTAYHGGAALITNKTILGAAASILAVEAYHAAEVRTLIVGAAAQAGASQAYLSDAVAISNLRAQLGGGNEKAPSASSIVAADPTTSIAYSRTTDQVLHIVYATGGGAGVAKGGFFPNGLNGGIAVTAS
jgi:hypothetical protein